MLTSPADRQVDTGKVARVTGARRVRMATPAEVTAATGFDPGSMAPFPPGRVESVFVDRAILRRSTVWVGGGSLRHRVALTPLELVRLTRGRVEPVGPRRRAPRKAGRRQGHVRVRDRFPNLIHSSSTMIDPMTDPMMPDGWKNPSCRSDRNNR